MLRFTQQRSCVCTNNDLSALRVFGNVMVLDVWVYWQPVRYSTQGCAVELQVFSFQSLKFSLFNHSSHPFQLLSGMPQRPYAHMALQTLDFLYVCRHGYQCCSAPPSLPTSSPPPSQYTLHLRFKQPELCHLCFQVHMPQPAAAVCILQESGGGCPGAPPGGGGGARGGRRCRAGAGLHRQLRHAAGEQAYWQEEELMLQ